MVNLGIKWHCIPTFSAPFCPYLIFVTGITGVCHVEKFQISLHVRPDHTRSDSNLVELILDLAFLLAPTGALIVIVCYYTS